jgi:hypothetical protein
MALVIFASLGSMLVGARQQELPIRFTNIAAEAGITFKHENGASAQKYMPETMAGGSIIFDYNNDGWPDLFFVKFYPLTRGEIPRSEPRHDWRLEVRASV